MGNHRSGNSDPMIRNRRVVAVEYRRVVVEFEPAQFAQFDHACGAVAPSTVLKLLALRMLAEAGERLPN
jgi:hypothetical protein